MLSPLAVTGGLIVDASEELELLKRNLLLLDTQFVVQLALSSALGAGNSIGQRRAGLTRDSQRVRAASVGPHIGEGDLLGGALLEEQLILVVEEEDGKRAV